MSFFIQNYYNATGIIKELFEVVFSPKILLTSGFVDVLHRCEGNAAFMHVCVLQLSALQLRKECVLLEDMLIFCTDIDRIPPGAFSTPNIQFLHDSAEILATASTCNIYYAVMNLPGFNFFFLE